MGLGIAFLGMLVFVGLIALVAWLVAFFTPFFTAGSAPAGRASSAQHTLDERLARGEIDAKEYEYWRVLLHDDELRDRAGARS